MREVVSRSKRVEGGWQGKTTEMDSRVPTQGILMDMYKDKKICCI
jgi:hypothetical protein